MLERNTFFLILNEAIEVKKVPVIKKFIEYER